MTPPSARPYRRRKLRVEAKFPQLAFAKKTQNRLLLTLRGTATGRVGALSARRLQNAARSRGRIALGPRDDSLGRGGTT